MTEAHSYTASEMLAILSARQLRDGQVVFAGIGVPLLAATLAQRTRCPALTILFEGGVIGAFVEPGKLPPSTNDQRCTKRANMVLGSADVLANATTLEEPLRVLLHLMLSRPEYQLG